jgi:hypothetical protein
LPKWKRAMQGKSMAKKKGETSQWEKSRAIEKELCVRCLLRIARDVYTHISQRRVIFVLAEI